MLALKLALKNLIGAGLRTWLNVFVLSLAFVMIVFQSGIIQGWNVQARLDMTEWEIGGGQYWHELYDPYDPLTLNDGHGVIPGELAAMVNKGDAAAVLVTQATIYPEGRMKNILLKGIDPFQKVLKLPSEMMAGGTSATNVMIGSRMAATTKLKVNDTFTIRWRDKHGTFDATEVIIAGIFHTNVPEIDNNQVWIPLSKLQQMTGMQDEATYLVIKQGISDVPVSPGWIQKGTDILFKDIDTIIKSKSISGFVVYLILLSLALLSVFDTQVLSIFRRKKR